MMRKSVLLLTVCTVCLALGAACLMAARPSARTRSSAKIVKVTRKPAPKPVSKPTVKPASKPAGSAKGASALAKPVATPKASTVPPPVVAEKSAPAQEEPAAAPPPAEGAYTSLVVDGSGYKLEKSMSPRIVRVDGSCVWGEFEKLTDEQMDAIQERGMVAYATTIEQACANQRAGAHPLTIKALGSAGSGIRSDLVISDEDAARVLAEDAKGAFLAPFNVIFVKNDTATTPEASETQPHTTDSPPPH